VDYISKAHQEIIDLFNAKYHGEIEVIPVDLPFRTFTTNERKEILTRSLRSGSEHMDIFAVDVIWGARFAKWGVILDDYLDNSIINKIHHKAISSCYTDNKLIALPLYLDVGVMYYRADYIRQLKNGREIEKKIRESLSWEELIELGKKFKDQKIPVYLYPGDKFEGMVCSFHEMLSAEESAVIFDGDQVNLNTEAAQKGLQLMVDLIYRYKLTPPVITEFDGYKSYIYANRHDAIFLRGWTGFHKHYVNDVSDTSKIKYALLAPLPHFKGRPASSVFGGWNLMISKNSTKKEEAVKFLKFTFRREIQQILYTKGGFIPINLDVYSNPAFITKYKELNDIKKIIESGRHRPFKENYTKISDIMSLYLHKALIRELNVEEALDNATQAINSKRVFIK
jgi:multiple sugar transport system substrate-binding protein